MTLETALALALTKALTLAQSLAQVIEAMVEHATTLQGLVLSLYGTGNGPSHKARFLTTIHKAIQRGIVVVAASQCQRGTVDLDAYEVGRRLLELGVVSAGDMTTESVVTKMAYLFGRGLSPNDIKQAMVTDLRGELTTSLRAAPKEPAGTLNTLLGIQQRLHFTST